MTNKLAICVFHEMDPENRPEVRYRVGTVNVDNDDPYVVDQELSKQNAFKFTSFLEAQRYAQAMDADSDDMIHGVVYLGWPPYHARYRALPFADPNVLEGWKGGTFADDHELVK
jgi:hypothetical protein|tara:strand:+ start:1234 stop:1575 length:342 start_codon:yes stop_codon:yes gene_type:complete